MVVVVVVVVLVGIEREMRFVLFKDVGIQTF